MLSILHRATGAFLSLGLVLTVIFLAALAGGQSSWETAQAVLINWFGYLVLFGFTLALNYHMCNGIRHLFWDIGHGYALEAASLANKVVLAATVALTVLVWLVALSA